MNLRDRIKELANQRKVSVAELERALGFGNGSISKWNKQSPSTEKLKQVADYFQVSLDYLVGRSDDKYDLSPQEKIDIGIEAEKMMKGLNDELSKQKENLQKRLNSLTDDKKKEKIEDFIKNAKEAKDIDKLDYEKQKVIVRNLISGIKVFNDKVEINWNI